jgi:hypothetical protein
LITIDDITKHKMVTGVMFRLVYVGNELICIIEGTSRSTTHTKHTVEEFNTEKAVYERVGNLGLETL